MKIWLINPYGPIPGEGWRDYSFTIAGTALAQAGHEVTWWTSNFSHHFKRHRSVGWETRRVSDGFDIRLVPTPGYKRNIGLGRIIRDVIFAFRTHQAAKHDGRPDAIIYAENPLTFGFAGPSLARVHDTVLIYDQMDLWPELIVNAMPRKLRPLFNFILLPVFLRRKQVYARLDGAFALAKPYLDAIISECPSVGKKPTTVIYNGIDVGRFKRQMTSASIVPAFIRRPSDQVVAIFAGSLGPSYDIPTLLDVCRRMQRHRNFTILIAGDGPLAQAVRDASADVTNLKFLGKLSPDVLARTYAECDIGLCAYSSTSNVEMPDKFYDYSAAGLAIINSLSGEVASLIQNERLGLKYRAGDADSLYSALIELEKDPSLLRTFKENSLVAGWRFDANQQYGNLASFVERVATEKTRATAPV